MSFARLAAKALRTRFWDSHPFILSHLLTARCNADCATCLWKMPADSKTDEMTTAEVQAMYKDATAAGFVAVVLWGGEPMVRADTGEVLKVAHGLGMNTTLITNGWFLDDRGDEVYPWLDRLLVSIDGLDERQDEIRRCPGLFQRIDRGLVQARRDHPNVRVIILTVISKLNVDQLDGIALYGKQHGAQVIFQAMNLTDYGFAGRVLDEERIRLSAGEEREVAERIDRLRRDGFPVRDSNTYLSRLGNARNDYTCHYKKAVLRVEPNGDVLDCTAVATPIVNVRTTSLRELIGSPAFRDFVGRAEACNRCRDAGVIETSHIWEGRIGAIWNAVRSL